MSANRSRTGAVLAALLLASAAWGAAPTDSLDWGAAPTLVRDDQGDLKAGARAHLEWSAKKHDLSRRFPWSRYHGISARYLWVPKGAAVPPQTELSGRFGTSVSLSRPNPPAPMDVSMDSLAELGGEAFDYGFLGLAGRAQYEASADRSEHAVAGGLELRYARVGWYLMPSVLATFDSVKPVSSSVRDAIGLDQDGYRRLMVRGYWIYSYRRLTGEVDASWFRSTGLQSALDALGWESGASVEATVSVRAGWPILRPIVLDSAFIRYADGQMPTSPFDSRAWIVGLDLGSR